MQLMNTLEYIVKQEASFDEEDSYYFLKDYQLHTDWACYSSKDYPLDSIKQLANLFCYSHGMVPLVDKENTNKYVDQHFWSSIPLGLFRYKMLEDGSWASVSIFNKSKGFIVEGVYWLNGFVYQVRNGDFVLEVNLFVDQKTKSRYNYPIKVE